MSLNLSDEKLYLYDSNIESSESEEEENIVKFSGQKYLTVQKIRKIEINKYYWINYGKVFIGCVTKIGKCNIQMTFLETKPNRYNWEKKSDIDNVECKYIFASPLSITGKIPFHIKGVDEWSLQTF